MPCESDRVHLTAEEAIAMLPDGDTVHTFRCPAPGMLLGADWSRADIEAAIREHGAELSGPAATSMNHGIALTDGTGPLFIETKPAEKTS